MFDIMFSPFTARLMRENVSFAWPDVDVSESEESYVFHFEIPGALKNDIKIWLENDVLTISGEKKRSSNDKDKALFTERAYGMFRRSFRLPEHIDRNNVKAEFVDGVLTVVIPKTPEAKPKEITINVK
jgi:HSP20 family protein